MVLLTQFVHATKKWFFSIHSDNELNLWEINLSPPAGEGVPAAELRRVWWPCILDYNNY